MTYAGRVGAKKEGITMFYRHRGALAVRARDLFFSSSTKMVRLRHARAGMGLHAEGGAGPWGLHGNGMLSPCDLTCAQPAGRVLACTFAFAMRCFVLPCLRQQFTGVSEGGAGARRGWRHPPL